MTDELDPQTQQHIDDPADVATDTDAVTCDGTDVDGPISDESATAETPETENADEQNDDAPAQDDAPVQDDAPQAAGPIEVSSEEELDAVMDSMMDAVKAMKDAVADADIDAEEEEAAEAASTFVPGETPVADQGSTMPSFLQLEHPTIGADAVDPHAAGFSVVEGGTGNIAAPQAADADAADTARPTALPRREPRSGDRCLEHCERRGHLYRPGCLGHARDERREKGTCRCPRPPGRT